MGELAKSCMALRCIRSCVFGDTDGGGRTGFLNTTAGVIGFNMIAGLTRTGDDDCGGSAVVGRNLV